MAAIPKNVIMAAEQAQQKWLVPTAVTLAQWALESAWGTREPEGSNNPFGIKAVAGQPFVETATHEVVDGKEIATTAKFAKYASLEDAFDAHGKLLATSKHYEKAMAARMDADAFASALTGVYATDPNYGSKLIAIMKANDLYEYDKLPGITAPPAAAPTEPAPVVAPPVVTLPVEPQHEPVAEIALVASIDKTVADLLSLKAQLKSINATLKAMVGE